MLPSALLRSHRSSRSKVGQRSVGIDGSRWSARVLEHDGRRRLSLDVLCRVVRSGQSRWERSRRARRQAAERPSSWQWKARSQEGSNGVGSQVRSVGEDWRIIGRCTDCWYSERESRRLSGVEEDWNQRGQSLRLNNVSMREQVLAWDDETRSSVELIVADGAAWPGQWLSEASRRGHGSQP